MSKKNDMSYMGLRKFSEEEVIRELQRKLSNFGVTIMWNVKKKHIAISGSKKAIDNLLAFFPEAEEVAQIIVRE